MGKVEKSLSGSGKSICKAKEEWLLEQRLGKFFLKGQIVQYWKTLTAWRKKLRILCRDSYNYKIQPFENVTNSSWAVKHRQLIDLTHGPLLADLNSRRRWKLEANYMKPSLL